MRRRTSSRSRPGSWARPVIGKLRGPEAVGRASREKSRNVSDTARSSSRSMLTVMFSVQLNRPCPPLVAEIDLQHVTVTIVVELFCTLLGCRSIVRHR